MRQRLLIFCALIYSTLALAECYEEFKRKTLQNFLSDPDYSVLFHVRHARAVQRNKGDKNKDYYRSLSSSGRESVAALRDEFGNYDISQSSVIVSGSSRTAETCCGIIPGLNQGQMTIHISKKLYHKGVSKFIKNLDHVLLGRANTAFVIGHQGSLEASVLDLTGKKVFIPTAGFVAVVAKTRDWPTFFRGDIGKDVFLWSPDGTHRIRKSK